LSQYLNFHLSIPAIDGFPRTAGIHRGGQVFDTPYAPYVLGVRHFLNYQAIPGTIKQTIVSKGYAYLENIFNFHHLRDDLIRIFDLPTFELDDYSFFRFGAGRLEPARITSISPRDVVISLRLGDFVFTPWASRRWKKCIYSRFLGYEYFRLILESMRFGRLFITSDEPFHPLVEQFKKHDPVLVANDSPLKTMTFIKKFNRIAISESTYSWWAAYLTSAEEIYFPISNSGLWGINTRWDLANSKWALTNEHNAKDCDLYLRVDDPRYKYVHERSGAIYNYQDAPGRRTKEDFM
jgi:hypothetical protein